MALTTSGAISLNAIHVEAGGTLGSECSINDTDIRSLDAASGRTIDPDSGDPIDFADFYGASASGGGGGGGGGGCLLYGSLVNMSDGSKKAIENIVAGDQVMSYNINGLDTSEEWEGWYTGSFSGAPSISTVVENKLNTYHHYFLINNILKVTWEQPFLVKSSNIISFMLTRDIRINDLIYTIDNTWIEVLSKERIDENIQVGVLDVEEVDNYYAEGFLTHNSKELNKE